MRSPEKRQTTHHMIATPALTKAVFCRSQQNVPLNAPDLKLKQKNMKQYKDRDKLYKCKNLLLDQKSFLYIISNEHISKQRVVVSKIILALDIGLIAN